MSYSPTNPNGQATAANSAPVVLAINQNKIPVEIAETQTDIHGQLVEVTRVTQLTTKFFQQTPQNALNITVGGTGAATSGMGTAIFSTGIGTTASVLAQTPATILYSAQYEAWGVLSGAFTTPTSTASFQRLGLNNTVDGFAFGFIGLTFGVLTRFNSIDTFIAQSAWNKDVLSGGTASTFRSDNIPVVLAPTNMNMYRIRYGWYGAVDTYFEVYSPDGHWVLVHQVRTANSQVAVNMTNPNLPMTVELGKTASDATNLSITCGGWAAGITAPSTGMLMSGQQNIAALNAAIILPTTGLASLSYSVGGTWVGTLSFQSSLDGITWNTFSVLDNATGAVVTQTTANSKFIAGVSTQRFNRVLATAWTSGTATIAYYGSSINSERPLLIDASGRQSVVGTFFQATQPVSIAATVLTDPSDRATRQLGVTSVRGLTLLPQSTAFAAAAVGSTVGFDVASSGNITFIIKNTVAATAWTGTPTITFEQSDDNVSWALLGVVRNDTFLSATSHILPANTANTEYMFDTAAEGITFVRARVTTGTATGGMTIVVQPGSLPFSPTAVSILNPETNKIVGTVNLQATTLTATITAASGVAATLSIPAVVGQFHYITSLSMSIYATAARTGAAAPVVVTTTNLTGAPAFTFETAQAIGTNTPTQGYNLTTPLRSATVNTATTIVAPIATAGIWRITATYFTAV